MIGSTRISSEWSINRSVTSGEGPSIKACQFWDPRGHLNKAQMESPRHQLSKDSLSQAVAWVRCEIADGNHCANDLQREESHKRNDVLPLGSLLYIFGQKSRSTSDFRRLGCTKPTHIQLRPLLEPARDLAQGNGWQYSVANQGHTAFQDDIAIC